VIANSVIARAEKIATPAAIFAFNTFLLAVFFTVSIESL